MMAKLGFKAGDALGKKPTPPPPSQSQHQQEQEQDQYQEERGEETRVRGAQGNVVTNDSSSSTTATTATTALNDWIQSRAEPLRLVVKEDRGGIGLDSEKKRKFREETEQVTKKAKAEEGEYRDRMRAEREERRLEGQVYGAQKVAEKLDTDAEEQEQEQKPDEHEEKQKKKKARKPIKQVNVLYRGLVREREEKERERIVRQIFENSLTSSSALTSTSTSTSIFPKPRLPTFSSNSVDEEDETDEHKPHALEDKDENITFEEQDTDATEEDTELDEFNALPASERLSRLVEYMREKYWYCFWCKYRYDSGEMEGCPGVTEEDHD